ncbi:hypothetical protein B0T26DRAFT_725198 [Lasiosphaeria miniovina]|uniref:Uncharacterized protein n=1 Tax=Lasiosphaeria miniovina TaxID=1954250 RepID=A0AA39ZYI5_9PEZI|nr:uncharacterized protein B0T26DRAFT_725198 [Lasiosphaeria miniovina]KAK0706007.1 hypothetical protein B0T26DRAFT_725198 [Lasiosphaeria miniovina]
MPEIADEMATDEVAAAGGPLHVRILSTPIQAQAQSPLFSMIPPEVRSDIFAFALADYADPSPDAHYEAETCFTRPAYFAPRKTDTRLLRTCRAVYHEAWFLPFTMREQTHWLTSQERAPPEYVQHVQLSRLGITLARITAQHGGEKVEIESLRVFAQMWALEDYALARLLHTPHLHPRRLTLTIRHADWWWWEQDKPLRFESGWIGAVAKVLPASVRELRIELESLERKKDQVDGIAKQMADRWLFPRIDGEVLYPDATGKAVEISRWSGASTWNGRRWERDESAPGLVDYYIATVVFRPRRVVERLGGTVSDSAKQAAAGDAVSNPSNFGYHLLRLRAAGGPMSNESDEFEDEPDEDEFEDELDEDEFDEDEDEDDEDEDDEDDEDEDGSEYNE